MELKALKKQEESGRTAEVTAENPGSEESAVPTSMQTDGAGNSDTGTQENLVVDDSNPNDNQSTSSNQTTSHSTSKKKRKSKKTKVQMNENPNGGETPAMGSLNSNTEKTVTIAARSNSNEKAGFSYRVGI